jgi:hypothetical protein
MANEQQIGEILGFLLGSMDHGITYSEVLEKKASHENAIANEHYQKTLAKIGAGIFKAAGLADGVLYKLYSKIHDAEGPLTKEAAELVLAPVASAMTKSAGGSWVDWITEPGKLATLAATIAGTAGGGAWWAINRHARLEDAEIQLKKEQAKHYRRIAKDLQKRLDATTKSDLKKTVEAENESDYVL